jgi:hypothetical protein
LLVSLWWRRVQYLRHKSVKCLCPTGTGPVRPQVLSSDRLWDSPRGTIAATS